MKLSCPYCVNPNPSLSISRTIYLQGRYWRKSDGRFISRFSCLKCKKGFSKATSHPCFSQNKRHKNQLVRKLLSAGNSQRETARILNLNRKTVVRKLLFWAKIAEEKLSLAPRMCQEVQFDDLETFEHTKCKPLSVTLVVEARTRRILDFEVAKMPAKGKLAVIARKKYGKRPDERAKFREVLFERVKKHIHPQAIIRSDSNPHYPNPVKRHFPMATHHTVMGARGCLTGQGELKKLKWDPLFSLNHTCAMLRANINRLIRQTWCTTKRPDRLKAHILLYTLNHNERVFQKLA